MKGRHIKILTIFGLIAIIAAAAVIVLISIEFFVYKMIKLKKQ